MTRRTTHMRHSVLAVLLNCLWKPGAAQKPFLCQNFRTISKYLVCKVFHSRCIFTVTDMVTVMYCTFSSSSESDLKPLHQDTDTQVNTVVDVTTSFCVFPACEVKMTLRSAAVWSKLRLSFHTIRFFDNFNNSYHSCCLLEVCFWWEQLLILLNYRL